MNPSFVLYLDNHLLIYNKQAGDIIQGDKTGDTPLSDQLKTYLKERYGKAGNVFLGVVHRLDRPVSGAVIFARTSKALSRMNLMLKQGEIRKTYWAVVQHPPPFPADHLEHYLVRNEKNNKSYITERKTGRSQKSELRYRVIARSARHYLLEVNLLTGRHHQIRAQLSFIGCPVRGDLKYGAPRSNPNGSIHLHSRRIEFLHPVKKEPLNILAPIPPDPVWDLFTRVQSPQKEFSE